MIKLALGLLALGLVSLPAEAGPAVNGVQAAPTCRRRRSGRGRGCASIRTAAGCSIAIATSSWCSNGAQRPGDRAVAALLVGARLIFGRGTMRRLSSFAALVLLCAASLPAGAASATPGSVEPADARSPRLQPPPIRATGRQSSPPPQPSQPPRRTAATPEKKVKKAKVRKHRYRYAALSLLAPRLHHSAAAILVPSLAALSRLSRPSALLRRVPVLLPLPLVVPGQATIRPLRRCVHQERLMGEEPCRKFS